MTVQTRGHRRQSLPRQRQLAQRGWQQRGLFLHQGHRRHRLCGPAFPCQLVRQRRRRIAQRRLPHFGHAGSDAVAQAQFFYNTVSADGTVGPADLPPVLDLETLDGQNPSEVLQWALAFLSEADALFGRQTMVYTDTGFWQALQALPGCQVLASLARCGWLRTRPTRTCRRPGRPGRSGSTAMAPPMAAARWRVWWVPWTRTGLQARRRSLPRWADVVCLPRRATAQFFQQKE